MNKIWAYLIIILAIIGFVKWYSDNQYDAGVNQCIADNVTAVNEAVVKDRESERAKQDEVDAEAKKQFDKLNDINNQLNVDLDRVRKRANRKQPTKDSKPVCEGATGKSLSSEDAGFLVREANRADRIRIALKACYNYADVVAK